ncbi:MAG: HAD hydrolase family protein [Clostridia bacterium]|nr:HAD hydrolase family protein [Clostridia bacterium]
MKIIASDYDGTLNYGGIDDTKRDAIQKWRNSGNVFAIVSGRGTADAVNILKKDKLGIDYFIAANGAIILNSKGDRISDVRCSGNLALPVTELLFECGCPFVHIETDFSCYIYSDKNKCIDNVGYSLDDVPEISYFNQISTVLPDYETAEKVTAIVKEKFGNLLNPMQNGTCIDIVKADVDKAKGIYLLVDILGAKKENVITVGDNINDKAMIKEFRSYAMENGVESIKALADGTVSSITQLLAIEQQLNNL